jgi:putative PIN family toxin of toxin-antitoxin system
LRVFFDTNVLVSAFTTRGLCAELFETALREAEVVVSEPVIEELTHVLANKFRAAPDLVARIAAELREREVVPAPVAVSSPVAADPADARIVACAIEAHADIFITGDQALLDLGEIEGLPILSPRQAWGRVAAGK